MAVNDQKISIGYLKALEISCLLIIGIPAAAC